MPMSKNNRPVSSKTTDKAADVSGERLSVNREVPIKAAPLSFFESVFNNTSIGMVLLDYERNIVKANLYFQELVKYSEKELQKLSIKEITHPDDVRNDAEIFKDVILNKKTDYVIEKRYIAKDGALLYVKLTFFFTDNLYPDKKLILAIVEDITKQKCLENNLASERNFLNVLLNNMPDSIYFKDLQSRFIKVSDAIARKHNLTNADMIGKTDFDLYSEEHARDAFNDEQNIIRTGIPIINKEEKETWFDRSVTWVSTTKMPFKDGNGNVIGTFGISRNITEKKKNELTHEALLKISETVFTSKDMQSMFETIHEVLATLMPVKNLFIALYDEVNNLLTFPYYVDEYDEPPQDSMPGRGLTEYILRTGKAQLIDEKRDYGLREEGEVETIGTPTKIWLGVPLKIGGKTIGVIVVQDYENPKAYREPEMQLISFIAEQIALVIERKRSAVAITNYNEELKQANATKDKFFSIIAHDLKNPFITILGFSELLLSDYEELTDEEKVYYLQEMKKTSENSHALLQNLLQWSRSQTGFIEFHPQAVDLSKVVEQNFELLFTTARKKEIELTPCVPAGIEVCADADMLNTIVRNLISNAIKFTPRGGVISVSANKTGRYVNVSVMDTGLGMNPDTLEKLFRIDVSHSSLGTEKETGSGLGLMLCREFVKKNGGDIWVESKVNSGSKFTFTVPAVTN
jgi:PAS domain S-box-containing protein